MEYNIRYPSQVEAQLEKLDNSIAQRIYDKIWMLRSNPNLGKPLKSAWKNYRRLRIGKYRIIYEISESEITIVKIGHRNDVYKLFRF